MLGHGDRVSCLIQHDALVVVGFRIRPMQRLVRDLLLPTLSLVARALTGQFLPGTDFSPKLSHRFKFNEDIRLLFRVVQYCIEV